MDPKQLLWLIQMLTVFTIEAETFKNIFNEKITKTTSTILHICKFL